MSAFDETCRIYPMRHTDFQPPVDVFSDLVLRDPIPLLFYSLQLIAMTLDFVQIVVGEIAPLFFDLAFELLPVTFHAIPVHDEYSYVILCKPETWLSAVPTTSCDLRRSFGTNGHFDACP